MWSYTDCASSARQISCRKKEIWTEALKLARQGVPVFPCGPDKRPLTPNGFKDATADPATVGAWWSEHPDALIGVPTGARFVVVDVDLQHIDAQGWLEANRYRLRLTRTHRTRSGGLHLLFAPNDKVKCSASKLGPHIDTRGHGGYIIWWPTCGLELLHGGVLAPVPDWIIEALNPKPVIIAPRRCVQTPAQAQRKIDGIIRTIAGATVGERNAVTFWGAARLAEMVSASLIDSNTAIAIAAEAASRSGLPHQEARRTAQSALNNHLRGSR